MLFGAFPKDGKAEDPQHGDVIPVCGVGEQAAQPEQKQPHQTGARSRFHSVTERSPKKSPHKTPVTYQNSQTVNLKHSAYGTWEMTAAINSRSRYFFRFDVYA